jgi:MerR family transcriptional regulator, copper efflux regulator
VQQRYPIQLPVLNGRRKDEPLVRRTLRVGELARSSGKTVRALHLYEEMGLLVPALRSKGGYRLYDADSVTRVRWIAKLQEMGFSLSEIQAMARQWEQSGSAPGAMAKVERLLQEKLADTRAQIERLQALERELQSSLDYLSTCPTCDPKQLIEACSACELHPESEQAPELVAGFSAH